MVPRGTNRQSIVLQSATKLQVLTCRVSCSSCCWPSDSEPALAAPASCSTRATMKCAEHASLPRSPAPSLQHGQRLPARKLHAKAEQGPAHS